MGNSSGCFKITQTCKLLVCFAIYFSLKITIEQGCKPAPQSPLSHKQGLSPAEAEATQAPTSYRAEQGRAHAGCRTAKGQERPFTARSGCEMAPRPAIGTPCSPHQPEAPRSSRRLGPVQPHQSPSWSYTPPPTFSPRTAWSARVSRTTAAAPLEGADGSQRNPRQS